MTLNFIKHYCSRICVARSDKRGIALADREKREKLAHITVCSFSLHRSSPEGARHEDFEKGIIVPLFRSFVSFASEMSEEKIILRCK